MNGKSLFIRISPELDTQFRKFIAEKYEIYEKGLLSHEVSEAMKQWMALHTTTQTTVVPVKPNPSPRVSIVYQMVKQRVQSLYDLPLRPGQEFPKALIERAIMAERGSDPRTGEHWFRAFGKMGLIKPTQGSMWEMM
jgi:hypothetical protein